MLQNGERQVAPDLSGIRRDHVARYEFAARELGAGRSLVDLACGVGYGSAVLAEAGNEVLAIDRSEEAIEYGKANYGREGVRHLCRDVSDISFDEEFDAAVCFETIEHLENPLPMLRELARVAPKLIASVPNEASFPHQGRIKFHFRHYTKAQFADLLTRAGYTVTAWYGQEGPFSEVEPNANGRTLVAVAERGPDVVAAPPVKETSVPDHVAILGLGPSLAAFVELTKYAGGKNGWCDEVWGINAAGNIFACDRIFHMDDVRVQEARAAARPESNIAKMLEWLKVHPGPIYTSRKVEGYPGLVEFPLEEVLNAKHDSNGGAPYFNSTTAYAIAYAVHLGVKRISLFGIDYTMPNRHMAEKGRACCEFWLGIAAARGIEITIPEQSSLMDACEKPESLFYGYDGVEISLLTRPDGGVTVNFTDKAALPSADDIERRYDHTKHPNTLVERGQI